MGPLLATQAACWVFTFAGIGLDLGAPFLLVWRRSRPFAFVVLAGFHLTNAVLFSIGA